MSMSPASRPKEGPTEPMSSSPNNHVCFYGPKGGQGTSTAAAAFALFASRLGLAVTLRAHDPRAMARHLALPPVDGHDRMIVTPSVELTELSAAIPPSRAVVDDLGRGHHRDSANPGTATRIMVVRPCCLAIAAAVEALDRQPPPDALLVVSEPDRVLGPSEVADALAAPLAAVVPLDPAVARAVDAGLLVESIVGRGPVPRSLRPLLDLAGRCLTGPSGAAATSSAATPVS